MVNSAVLVVSTSDKAGLGLAAAISKHLNAIPGATVTREDLTSELRPLGKKGSKFTVQSTLTKALLVKALVELANLLIPQFSPAQPATATKPPTVVVVVVDAHQLDLPCGDTALKSFVAKLADHASSR